VETWSNPIVLLAVWQNNKDCMVIVNSYLISKPAGDERAASIITVCLEEPGRLVGKPSKDP